MVGVQDLARRHFLPEKRVLATRWQRKNRLEPGNIPFAPEASRSTVGYSPSLSHIIYGVLPKHATVESEGKWSLLRMVLIIFPLWTRVLAAPNQSSQKPTESLKTEIHRLKSGKLFVIGWLLDSSCRRSPVPRVHEHRVGWCMFSQCNGINLNLPWKSSTGHKKNLVNCSNLTCLVVYQVGLQGRISAADVWMVPFPPDKIGI